MLGIGLNADAEHKAVLSADAVRPDHRGRAVGVGAPCACSRQSRHLTGDERPQSGEVSCPWARLGWGVADPDRNERRQLCSGRRAHVPHTDLVRCTLRRAAPCDCTTRPRGAIATRASASRASHVRRWWQQRRRGDDERRRPRYGRRIAVRRHTESKVSTRVLSAAPASEHRHAIGACTHPDRRQRSGDGSGRCVRALCAARVMTQRVDHHRRHCADATRSTLALARHPCRPRARATARPRARPRAAAVAACARSAQATSALRVTPPRHPPREPKVWYFCR